MCVQMHIYNHTPHKFIFIYSLPETKIIRKVFTPVLKDGTVYIQGSRDECLCMSQFNAICR